MYMKRAVELKSLDYTHWQIAEALHKEFNMEKVPAISTVSYLLDGAYQLTDEEIKRMQWQWRLDQFKQLERLRQKWMTLALTDELTIQRHGRDEQGEETLIMDENATAEQLKATNECVKIMARQARLFGLDLEKQIEKDDGGFANLQDMQVWIIQQINHIGGAPTGAPMIEDRKSDGIVLELKSGLEDEGEAI